MKTTIMVKIEVDVEANSSYLPESRVGDQWYPAESEFEFFVRGIEGDSVKQSEVPDWLYRAAKEAYMKEEGIS